MALARQDVLDKWGPRLYYQPWTFVPSTLKALYIYNYTVGQQFQVGLVFQSHPGASGILRSLPNYGTATVEYRLGKRPPRPCRACLCTLALGDRAAEDEKVMAWTEKYRRS